VTIIVTSLLVEVVPAVGERAGVIGCRAKDEHSVRVLPVVEDVLDVAAVPPVVDEPAGAIFAFGQAFGRRGYVAVALPGVVPLAAGGADAEYYAPRCLGGSGEPPDVRGDRSRGVPVKCPAGQDDLCPAVQDGPRLGVRDGRCLGVRDARCPADPAED
jgi:hypothetical protein